MDIIKAGDFDNLTQIVMGSLSESSRRVYRHTYDQWREFVGPGNELRFTLAGISDFVHADNLTHSARLQRLSHLKTLLRLMAISSPEARQMYEAAAFIKVHRAENDERRSRRALSHAEVRALLAVWQPGGIMYLRNLALLHVAIFTGMRRSELAALRWDDIDLDCCLIRVRAGKGGKARTVALADATDGSCQVLRQWQRWQRDLGDFDFVFPKFTRGKNPTIAANAPMAGETVKTVVKRSAELAGLGHLSPHDLRRTHITLALDNGAPIGDMQAQAGHADAKTTMRYAIGREAAARKQRIAF